MEELHILKSFDQFFVHGVVVSMITIGISLLILLIANTIMNHVIHRHFKTKERLLMKIKKGILIVLALSCILVEIVPLQSLLKTLLASGGIIAVIVGLASQEAASSMINGFMIVAYKPYAIGDMIYVPSENIRGEVIDITSRHTVIRTLEKTQVTIPNTIMNKVVIENITNTPNQKANYLYLDVSYESDIKQAIAIIQQEAQRHPLCIDVRNQQQKAENQPTVPVYCLEFKDSSISLRATVHSKNSADGFTLLSDLRCSIKQAFDEQGIEIPYQQVVVHHKNNESNKHEERK